MSTSNDMASTIVSFVALLWPLAGMIVLWLGGGAKRNALGFLSAGLFFFISGALFVYVPAINVYARMDNAYLGNIFEGAYLVFWGGTFLLVSLAGYGVPLWLAALLLPCGIVLAFLTESNNAVFGSPGSGIVLFTAMIVGGILTYLLFARRWREAAIAVAFSGIGLWLVWWRYSMQGNLLIPIQTIGATVDEPPYLDDGTYFFCILVGIALFLAARFFQGYIASRPIANGETVATEH